ELVDLEHERIPIAVLVLAGHQLDAVRRTHRWTEAACDALRLPVLGREHPMRPPPARRQRPLLVGVLDGHLLLEQMLEGERHPLERGAYVARLLDRTLEHLDADGH